MAVHPSSVGSTPLALSSRPHPSKRLNETARLQQKMPGTLKTDQSSAWREAASSFPGAVHLVMGALARSLQTELRDITPLKGWLPTYACPVNQSEESPE